MTCIKAWPLVPLTLAVTLYLPTSAAGQSTPAGATGPMWVRPIKENVVVYTSTGAKVERIGILTTENVVQVVGEDRGWYKVKYTSVSENAEFVGWVLKAEVAVEGTPANPPVRQPKPASEETPKKEEKTEPEKKTLSIPETHEQLLKLVEVPVSEAPQYTVTYNLEGMKDKVTQTGNTGMTLFGPYKAKLEVLQLFPPDAVIAAYIEDEKIRNLEELRREAHPDFHRVIDWYIRALEAYLEKKANFQRLINSAEAFWKRIPGIEVGF